MNVKRWVFSPLIVAGGFVGGVFVSTNVTGDLTPDAERASQVDTATAIVEGGEVLQSDLPDVIPVVGPSGCIVVDASGEPVELSTSDVLEGPAVVVGRNRRDNDVVIVEQQLLSDIPDTTEDCSLDVEAVTEEFFATADDDVVTALEELGD